ncbi:DUF3054 domain-containing protein [Allosalinactinospora lopnorensis]|uniref:DUF3054 domain-containing protein n=1 Tax=Allosalinactinospora lopnorensis TaxID=1352348 RepID=UPI000623D732|nr:DUF3054 domain-containing protein [Allosalinactinospora lopnorensis]
MRSIPVSAAAALDLLCVLIFVVAGRAEHERGNPLAGIAETAWPFLAALVAGWLITLAWRAPARILPTGLLIWAVTVVGGMLLRVLGGGSTQLSFFVVTALFLGATLIGWRAVAQLARPRGTESRVSP